MATAITTNDYIKGHDKNTKDIDTLTKRISDIVANNGNGTKDVEIVDARRGKASLRDRIDEVENKIAINNDEISKETKDARIDFDGGIHKNLNLRLLEDFNNLYKLIYNSTLLEYEGQYITANNSYKGITEDMKLKGRTMQNLLKSVRNDILVQYGSVATWQLYKPGTVYTIKITNKSAETKKYFLNEYCFTAGSEITLLTNQTLTMKINTLASFTQAESAVEVLLKNKITHTQPNNLEIVVLEDDWTNKNIPGYFEGIRSVGETGENLELVSCGKNLFNGWLRGRIDSNTGKITYSDMQTFNVVTKYINVKKLTKYVTSVSDQFYSFVAFYDIDKKYISRTSANPVSKISFETPSNCSYIVLTQYTNNIDFSEELLNTLTTQIEEGAVTTPYEQYKEHRQAITLIEPLRGLPNGVRDVVDFEKGVVARNVGKVVLNGSESWSTEGNSTNKIQAYTWINIKSGARRDTINVICNNFPCISATDAISENSIEGVAHDSSYPVMRISILKSRLTTPDKDGVLAWLKANPITVYHELAKPIETTIDLTPPRTYEPITNIFTQGSLIEPNLSCKIPSNIPAKIQSLSSENKTLQAENINLRSTVEENNLAILETNVRQEAKITMMELGVI